MRYSNRELHISHDDSDQRSAAQIAAESRARNFQHRAKQALKHPPTDKEKELQLQVKPKVSQKMAYVRAATTVSKDCEAIYALTPYASEERDGQFIDIEDSEYHSSPEKE